MLTVRALTPADLPALREQFAEHWGGPEVISRGRRYAPEDLEGLVALEGDAWAGSLTFQVAEDGASCELVTLLSLLEGRGAATALHAFFFFMGQASGPVLFGLGLLWIGAPASIVVSAGIMGALGIACWNFFRKSKVT